MEEKIIKSYKAFDSSLSCQGFQYEVGKEYKIKGHIECCIRGFNACESPLEVFDHYDMLKSRFAEVEQSGYIDRDEDTTKVCSSRIRIKAELKLADIINIGIQWLKDITSPVLVKKGTSLSDNGEKRKQIDSSVDSARIGSSGDSVEIGSSGNCAQIGSLGNFAQIGSSGDFAKIGSFGDFAQISSSGDYAKINSTGSDSVIMCAGCKALAKAKIGSWITLSEWVYSEGKGRYVPICVKTEFVDGKNIKADTYYQLIDGVFTEVNK